MVALNAASAARIAKTPNGSLLVWLLHGADTGLIAELASAVTHGFLGGDDSAFGVMRMDGEAFSTDPECLLNEWNGDSLFASRRVLRLSGITRDITDDLRHCLDNPNDRCVIIIVAGALRRDSALRMLCERDKRAAAVECGSESRESFDAFVRGLITDNGLTPSPEALDLLISALGGDRIGARSELEKLAIYMGGEGSVDVDAIDSIIVAADSRDADIAIDAALRGELNAATAAMSSSGLRQNDNAAVVASCLRICLLVHRARAEIAAGMSRQASMEKALRSAGPFRRYLGQFLDHADAENFRQLVENLSAAVPRIRESSQLSDALAMRTMWSAGYRARRR